MLGCVFYYELSATELANTVTSLSTILAGIVPIVLEHITKTQPKRWVFAYWSIFISGIFTILYHGLGETYVLGRFDVGSNLLIVIALLNAFLGDFYGPKIQRKYTTIIGGVTASIFVLSLVLGETNYYLVYIPLGGSGGFYLLEILLIVNAWLLVFIVIKNRKKIPLTARKVLYFAIILLFIAFLFATGSNHVVYLYWISMHAIWHMFHASVFTIIWIGIYMWYNEKTRGNEPEKPKSES